VPWGALGKNVFAECRAQEALGKICFQKIKKHFTECPRMTLGKVFLKKNKNKFCRAPGFPECQALGKVQICRVPDFAECLALGKVCFAECKILPSATLGKILLCRVPRYFALGKVQFSSSGVVMEVSSSGDSVGLVAK